MIVAAVRDFGYTIIAYAGLAAAVLFIGFLTFT
jgi:hypothetical protein